MVYSGPAVDVHMLRIYKFIYMEYCRSAVVCISDYRGADAARCTHTLQSRVYPRPGGAENDVISTFDS